MIVYVKEIGTRRTPFAMRKEAAEKLVNANKGLYEILSEEPVEPIQPIEITTKVASKKKVKQDAVEAEDIKDLREE